MAIFLNVHQISGCRLQLWNVQDIATLMEKQLSQWKSVSHLESWQYNGNWLISTVRYLLWSHCCSSPHWAHRLGTRCPHWQAPWAQQAHNFFLFDDPWHGHPVAVLVHMSTSPGAAAKVNHLITLLHFQSILLWLSAFTLNRALITKI